MFDVNAWEFVTIGVVALVVLGPERLPEAMRRAGQGYRQIRELLAQYTAEAQQLFEEGLREVEDVSAAGGAPAATASDLGPLPRLRQPPPALRAPVTVADAGPWMVPARHHDRAADPEPQPGRLPASRSALERLPPTDATIGTYERPRAAGCATGCGGPAAGLRRRDLEE